MENTPSLFTCQSCSVAFHSSDDQRAHYRSDHHRYNMQRRVAGLAPLSSTDYNSKVLERRAEMAGAQTPKDWNCLACRKVYTTENAYLSHLNSKRHRENEAKPMFQRPPPTASSTASTVSAPSSLEIPEDADEETINALIDERIAAAEAQLTPAACLFCPHTSPDGDVAHNLAHMHADHSFIVPHADHLTDAAGLVLLLAGKVAVAHVCLYCAREFRTLDAVRKHMIDKSHAKVPFETSADRREVAEFYSFPSSSARIQVPEDVAMSDADLENVDDAETVDGVDAEDPPSSDASDSDVPINDNPFELVLRGGQRIGHRSLARYYKQRLVPLPTAAVDPHAGAALVRALQNDKTGALVPARGGGFGAFGAGTQVVKARNAGEAQYAGMHVKLHRDQKRREEFRTRVAFIANHQKH
ncbi:cytoplasmic protein, partial [Exidia glandulosa HHB12029]